tara:strand:- start:245 stop:439 length:195 start_codon:yes stop_codon:yes gene_type:complete
MVSVFCEDDAFKQNAFKIVTIMKQHIFAAASEDEMLKWIISLKEHSDANSKKSLGGRISLRGLF